ncbi:MAG: VWA domain-containing protein [candidate division Zixibacteria bacterium]|nr:VWA domain-containing protein [candidate division Zixibacteria bacterium]
MISGINAAAAANKTVAFRIVEFSSLKHLRAMQKRQVRRLKIRQLLLLLLRMLIILAVVLAFARPTVTEGGIGSHASVSAVILFDNSASMNRYVSDGNLFEIARSRTRELLTTFGEADQVALLALDRTTEEDVSLFSTPAAAMEMLERLTVGSGMADMESALDKAIDILDDAASLNKEIHLVTDRQRCSLPSRPLLSNSEMRICYMDLPVEEDNNCGIIATDFGGELLMPGHDFDITATIKNYSSDDRPDLIASLFFDGNRVGQTDVQVPAAKEAVVRFTHAFSRTGFHAGRVELSDDRFIGDNRYYFSFHIPDKFNLLIIRGDNAARLVSLALVPSLSINQYWSVKEVAPDKLSGVNFLDYDVIVVNGAPSLADTYIDRLTSFVKRGKSLFITYGGDTDIDHFNSRWSQITGVVYDEPVNKDFSRAGFYTVGSVDTDHPIFSVFGFETNELPQIKFYSLPRLHVQAEENVLMRFTGDRPALVENAFGRGKVLTFTGPMAPHYTDLTSHAFFVPFVSRVAEYLASDLSSIDLNLFAGDNISRSVSIHGTITAPLQLTTPDSSIYGVPPEEGKGRLVFRPKPVDLAGIYRVSYLGREVDRFAVNLKPAEGNLTAVDIDQLATALGAKEFNVLEQDRELADIISELRFGKELWQLFLWAAVILLVIEILLSRGTPPEEKE